MEKTANPLIKLCPNCAKQNDASASFCYACGARCAQNPIPLSVKKRPSWIYYLIGGVSLTAIILFASLILLALGLRNKETVSPGAGSVKSMDSPTPEAAPTLTPRPRLILVKSRWERGGFGAVVIWRVTLRNDSPQPIGDIQYRTTYYSETGNIVDRGGIDSPLNTKIIQKVIPPKSTRTVEVNDGFTHSEANRANFDLVDWRIVPDQR